MAVPHSDRANESNISLLTRLAKRLDAVATVKASTLIFAPIGSGPTPSSIELPGVQITRQSGDQHRCAVSERERFTGARSCLWARPTTRRSSNPPTQPRPSPGTTHTPSSSA
jgi:phage protein D